MASTTMSRVGSAEARRWRPSWPSRSLAGDIDRYDLIFEPQTYQFLGWQVVPKAENAVQQFRRGVTLHVTIVDHAGQTP
ncbi:hypothetical protein ABZ671_08820 [Micromonospora sp. NPDC006766]|uniref:hypothetical protein n=1 Tax=Micromonospora sp. NPDC006766 TaxID=3154778 RepID=UPI0033D8AAA5